VEALDLTLSQLDLHTLGPASPPMAIGAPSQRTHPMAANGTDNGVHALPHAVLRQWAGTAQNGGKQSIAPPLSWPDSCRTRLSSGQQRSSLPVLLSLSVGQQEHKRPAMAGTASLTVSAFSL
jgi:hypothetical protein